MYGDFANVRLCATPEYDMKNPVIFIARGVSVVVDVVAVNGDIADRKYGPLV